mgnify:CR=1 FL=1|jgi:hypothetical protein|tara:strand:+ start:1096 stop:1512 length:417 start_codon:yes stop_codon:yes gene_type:complete
MAKEIVKLSPLCLPDPKGKRPGKNGQKHVMPMAVNNRGYLLPCCWCDEKNITSSKQFKPLYDVSKLEDYNNINEILETKEWIEFENDLINARDIGDEDSLKKVQPVCIHHCKVRKEEDKMKIETHFSAEGKKVVEEVK